jgi:hypothetical protein
LAKFAKMPAMSTINISLPRSLVNQLDQTAKKFDFSNRSEFVRALLRRVFADKSLLTETSVFPFSPPATRSRAKLMTAFKKTGRYSKKFLADLAEGLKTSGYFQE